MGLQVLRLLLMRPGAKMQRPVQPDRWQRRGVRPPVAAHGRSQNISVADSTSATSVQGRVTGPGSLNPWFSSAAGSVPGIGALLYPGFVRLHTTG